MKFFIIGFFIGGFIGMFIFGLMAGVGSNNKSAEDYERGFNDGMEHAKIEYPRESE